MRSLLKVSICRELKNCAFIVDRVRLGMRWTWGSLCCKAKDVLSRREV